MHQPRTGAHTPKRRRTYFEARGLRSVLYDAIARADVMQQEVAERPNDFEAEMGVRRQCSTINHNLRPGRNDRRDMTDTAAVSKARHGGKELPAFFDVIF